MCRHHLGEHVVGLRRALDRNAGVRLALNTRELVKDTIEYWMPYRSIVASRLVSLVDTSTCSSSR
jgi:hypothetical protein